MLAKNTFSTVYPSRSIFPCTTALRGVCSGSGHNPSATLIWVRNCAARAFPLSFVSKMRLEHHRMIDIVNNMQPFVSRG